MALLPDSSTTQQVQQQQTVAAPAAPKPTLKGGTPTTGMSVGNLPAATAPQPGDAPPQITPATTADPMAFSTSGIGSTPGPSLNMQQVPSQTDTLTADVPPGGAGPVNSTTAPTTPPTPPSPQVPPTTGTSGTSTAPVAPPTYTGPAFQPNLGGPSPFGVDAGVAGTSPLTGKTTQQIDDYWAGQGAINPANLGLGTDATPAQIAAATAQYKATHGADIDAITKQVQGDQAAGIAAGNQRAQTFDDNNQHAMDGALATALNGQQGYAGSGLNYADPNNPGKTIANPLSQNQTPQGGVGNTTTQTGPTSQGGVVLPQNPTTSPGITAPTAGPSTIAGTSSTPPGNGPSGSVSLTPTDPSNSLLGQTISAGPTADRVKTFQDALNSTIKNVIDPSYDASTRDLNRYNFGAGRGVSGEARTSQGDLADRREQRIADLGAQGLASATNGSIDDAFKNVGIAQQQQGFQEGQNNDAFNQQAELAQLQDALTNSAFGRASAQSSAGEANSPANIGLILSQIFGNQAGQAGQAAAGAFGNLGKNSANSGGLSVDDILKYIQGGGNKAGTPNPGGYDVNGEPLTQ